MPRMRQKVIQVLVVLADGVVFNLGDYVQIDLGRGQFGAAVELPDRARVDATER